MSYFYLFSSRLTTPVLYSEESGIEILSFYGDANTSFRVDAMFSAVDIVRSRDLQKDVAEPILPYIQKCLDKVGRTSALYVFITNEAHPRYRIAAAIGYMKGNGMDISSIETAFYHVFGGQIQTYDDCLVFRPSSGTPLLICSHTGAEFTHIDSLLHVPILLGSQHELALQLLKAYDSLYVLRSHKPEHIHTLREFHRSCYKVNYPYFEELGKSLYTHSLITSNSEVPC
jgi:hypothetical protein